MSHTIELRGQLQKDHVRFVLVATIEYELSAGPCRNIWYPVVKVSFRPQDLDLR